MKTRFLSGCYRMFFICFVMLFFIVFCRTSPYAENVQGVTDDTIKIGMILDQTGPGAHVVVPITKGIKSYFKHINQQGGINGRKLETTVEDDRYSIPMAITAFKKLVYKDKVFTLIGPTSTGGITALIHSIQKEKIPFMSAIMPEITVKPFKRYIFIIADIYPNQMTVLIDYILKDFKLKEPRFALIYPDNETGKVDRGAAIKILKSYNLIPVSKEVLNPGSLDAGSQVMSLRRNKVNCVILCGQIPQTTVVLLRELKKYGLNIPVFGSWATCVEEVIDMAGTSSERFYAVNHMSSWYDTGAGLAKMRKITLKYFPGTERPYRGKIYTHGWVMATIVREALERAGRDLNGEGYITAVESIQNFDTKGLCGPINYSSTSHKGGNTWKMFKTDVDTGKFIPLTEWRRSD
ncbi:MAG: ABC transporter substrate-binding protein [Thermodesulfobacteriota bacterium]|nr:ABC transporter substrate-binding protein [Thermodesulfobacteriota bacterium]